MQFKSDIFEPDVKFVLEEGESEVNGQSILAKVSGVFFVPDGTSRNKRYYPKSLWEKALGKPEIKEKLASRRMLGTIGHDQLINDMAILEGKVSHIVTSLKIDENGKGIGEALILDTKAGKVLNTLLRAGSKLFVSSRATGKYADAQHKGMPIVDENTYALSTFDFVIDPGFLEANPELKESFEEMINDKNDTTFNQLGEGDMSGETKLAEHITNENHKLKTDLKTAITEVDDLKGKLAIANNDLDSIKEENVEAHTLKETLTKYESLGTVEDLSAMKEAFAKNEAELKEFKEIDPESNPKEIGEVIDAAKALIEEYKLIGSPEKITEALTSLAERIEKYEDFGTENEVEELFDLCNTFVEKEKSAKVEAEIKALATELGVEEAKIAKVYGKLSVEEIKEIFANVKKVEAKPEDKKNDKKVNEDKKIFTADKVDLKNEGKKEGEEENEEDEEAEAKKFKFERPLVEKLMKRFG